MSRITADVIDVMENEKTRVEILDIGGEDPEQALKPKLYYHKIALRPFYGETQLASSITFTCLSSSKEPITTIQDADKLIRKCLPQAVRVHNTTNVYCGVAVGFLIELVYNYYVSYYDTPDSTVKSFVTNTIELISDTVTEA